MLTKLEYLKSVITRYNIIEDKNWFIHLFAIPLLKDTSDWEHKALDGPHLITTVDGICYGDITTDENGVASPKLSHIVDYKKGKPLFHPQDIIEVDNTWLSSIEGTIRTKVGTLLVNSIILHQVVGKRIPYLNKEKMEPKYIEGIVIGLTRNDDQLTDKHIAVKEMIEIQNRLNFFADIANVVNIGATRKTITPPPGIKEKKKKLIAEYGDKLKDPVEFVRFENELEKVDKDYLADDPAARSIFNKKSKTGRKKMFLDYGPTLDFIEDPVNNRVISSLDEGLPTDPKEFAKAMNDTRFGSFSRGSSTALSGYSYKILQWSISGIGVTPTPCKTTQGFKRLMTEDNFGRLVGRYIKEKNWVLIPDIETAKKYINKTVEVRSSTHCINEGNDVCYACMSASYKDQPNGTSILASFMSDVLMTTFLKLNHGVITELVELKDTDLFT